VTLAGLWRRDLWECGGEDDFGGHVSGDEDGDHVARVGWRRVWGPRWVSHVGVEISLGSVWGEPCGVEISLGSALGEPCGVEISLGSVWVEGCKLMSANGGLR
jgi:hypothetical protein